MSRSAYSRGEPKRLLEKAAASMPEGAVMSRDMAQSPGVTAERQRNQES